MKITTYDELIAEAKNWSGRTDLTDDQYHSFSYLTGSMASQILRVAPMEWTTVITVGPDGQVVIPPDFYELKSLTWEYNDDDSKPLQQVSWEQFVNYRNGATATADTDTKWFAQQGPFWFLAPNPVSGTSVTCHYFRTIPDIDAVNQTNWLVQLSPLTYLYGVLHFLHLFVYDEERGEYWRQKMEGELARLQNMYDSSLYKGTRLAVQSLKQPGDYGYGV